MNCEQVRNRLSDYIDGDTLPDDYHAISQHLDTCYLCREVLEQVQSMQRLCQISLRHPAPLNRFEQLELEMNLGYVRRMRSVNNWWVWGGRAASTVALVASLILVTHLCLPLYQGSMHLAAVLERQSASPDTLDPLTLRRVQVPVFSRSIIENSTRIALALNNTFPEDYSLSVE